MSGARLDDRVVLVTGGARGQGASHARHLAREGARVVITDLRDELGEQTAAELSALGLDVSYLHHDVTSEESWISVVGSVVETHGRIDGLVNNAGIVRVVPIADETLDGWSRVLSVNAASAFLGVKTVAPILVAHGGGSIVNVSSTSALVGSPGYAAYCASKAAVLGLTRVAALEYAGSGVRVNALCPGGVSTAMNDDEPPGGVGPSTPLGRRAVVDEISPLVVYLMSNESFFMTGSEVVIDGGFTAQ
ncbi:SDR family oxidoreductase [Agreia sp. PsM10]|uniref:SDR family NAD(P)-dependent oxidoreductase n=1 Tax=Agreia sp. PsM10 TaxID=3030533 RepID=UPI00263B116C|nr:SDR family oxidoreductase [Agreia sp. PsM10]MDN4641055.1 SDR family oxidoreductase [Agreia sp. PsM10]